MDVCLLLVGLVILLIVIGIIVKIIGWGAAVAGGIGQYRSGKAMKQISQQGLTVKQAQQYQAQQDRQPPKQSPQIRSTQDSSCFCDQCGAPLKSDSKFCPGCGNQL